MNRPEDVREASLVPASMTLVVSFSEAQRRWVDAEESRARPGPKSSARRLGEVQGRVCSSRPCYIQCCLSSQNTSDSSSVETKLQTVSRSSARVWFKMF